MYKALVARVRYHIQKANFMGLKEAESTLLLKEAADAIEGLSREVEEYKAAYRKEHNKRIAENRYGPRGKKAWLDWLREEVTDG